LPEGAVSHCLNSSLSISGIDLSWRLNDIHRLDDIHRLLLRILHVNHFESTSFFNAAISGDFLNFGVFFLLRLAAERADTEDHE
jgi:hypothetical protein